MILLGSVGALFHELQILSKIASGSSTGIPSEYKRLIIQDGIVVHFVTISGFSLFNDIKER